MAYFIRVLGLAITCAVFFELKGMEDNPLTHWDEVVEQLSEKDPLQERGIDRLRGYLYYAQRKIGEKSASTGDIDSVSLFVIQLFYPEYQGTVTDNPKTKDLRDELNRRFKKENEQIHPVTLQKGGGWVGKVPYVGLKTPTWEPWVLKSADEFRVEAPPKDPLFWKDQIVQIRDVMQNVTEPQKKRILFWAGMPTSLAGDWIIILNEYIQKTNPPLSTQLKVREAVAIVIVDATIGAFDSKYAYLTKRPDMVDPTLKTEIPTPNHPSYPAGHSAVSAAVVEVLRHYFPENNAQWQKFLEEAGMSRIWAGIHFPIDHQVGQILGKNVGKAVLQRLNK